MEDIFLSSSYLSTAHASGIELGNGNSSFWIIWVFEVATVPFSSIVIFTCTSSPDSSWMLLLSIAYTKFGAVANKPLSLGILSHSAASIDEDFTVIFLERFFNSNSALSK